MDIGVTLPGGSADELRALYRDLARDFELRGQVRLVEAAAVEGTLGSVEDMLVVALGQGGVGVALAGAVVAWVRNRASDVVCKLTGPDGSVAEVSATRLRGCDAATLRQVVQDLSATLQAHPTAVDESVAPEAEPTS